ncbi:class I SAM-dependent methyltransferase [Deinococcus hopiensis]|uniref:Methylase involved in ubiquinone/menaquinone biosynthesis n=1 Tax=Deinococcus hopiensis KR-140 TaxID=695939 RepID=A0A1W1UYD6_9DEIO|nr:class I SAM-dependent methyltransferase [Deinococcus hopiensis]SMB86086.1 Methylase involved in ubiquinone/menaquinone biosynthesis [Deinococcus hopiensis KR-140]
MDWTTGLFDLEYARTDLEHRSAQAQADVQVMRSLLRPEPHHAVLDLGCGLGRHTLALAREGFTQVTGLDFVPAYLERSREQAQRERIGVKFLLGSQPKCV